MPTIMKAIKDILISQNIQSCLWVLAMTNQEVLGEFLSLPVEAQSQVVSLIAFLKQRYSSYEPLSESPNGDLMNDPFVGMWHDRRDLRSTTENSSW